MKACKKCSKELEDSNFYANDSSCKDCRKRLVRENRAKNAEYYREYDKKRYQCDPKVKERHLLYLNTDKGQAAAAKAKGKWATQNPVKRAAQVILGNAVRDGKLKKPGFCEQCGSTGRIHGHHCDYAKPLAVMWLCAACHKQWHADNGEGANG